ncbi:MAG: hypothetical protein WC829_18470 [Hyphomicrobium sp.]|jgi:hypothetical protein
MLKFATGLAVCAALLASPSVAAQYDCAKKETGVKLNDYDITIGKRESAIAEMQSEVKDGGGATEQQKKALEHFEQKLAAVKAEREKLLADCAAK